MPRLKAETVRKFLDYDPSTGILTWKARGNKSFDTQYAGKPALTYEDPKGYLAGYIDGHRVRAHQAAWLHYYGEWPEHQIDHDNGKKSDNRIENLFDRPQSENNKNSSLPKDNTSGHIGVSWHKASGKWMAHIRVDKKRINLGLHEDKQDAIDARKAAERKYGFNPNHGRKS